MKAHYWETRLSMTSQKALQFLREGNERFINNLRVNRNMLQLINETVDKQFPFAAILSCRDSRVPVELIFDQGLGDIFSIRLAGNIASTNAIGSMEYACRVLGSKLLMVMGHRHCGAVKGAIDGFKMDNLTPLLDCIEPAVQAVGNVESDLISSKQETLDKVIHCNVEHQMKEILSKSRIIRDMLEEGEIDLVGAVYDIETGKVQFLDQVDRQRAGAGLAEMKQY